MRCRVLVAAGVLGLASMTAGCGGTDTSVPAGPLAGTDIVFSISLAEEERAAVRDVIDGFQEKTGARVRLVSITAADLPQKLAVELAAGAPTIHLFAQDNLATRILVDRGLVQDVRAAEIPQDVPSRLIPAAFGGRRYFLPFRPNVRVTYANTARLRQAGVRPPRSVEELRAVARRLRAAAGGVPKVVLSLARGEAAAVTIAEWVVSFGGDPLVLNDEGSVRALEFLQDMWTEGLLARESLLAKYDTVVDYLQGETAWLAQNWPFTSGVLARQGVLDRFAVYAGWRGPVRAAHVVGGDVLGMPRGVSGNDRKAALALARCLMSREAQEHLAERNAWPSIRSDATARLVPAQRATFAAIDRALASGWYRPSVPYWAAVSDAMNDAVERILVAGEAARPALDILHRRVEAAARERGSSYPPRLPR